MFRKNGGYKQIWRDGILLAYQDAGAAALLGLEDLTIGAGSGGGNKFTGLIDDFAVWDNALSADDIQRLANGTNPLWIGVPEPASASLLVLSALGLGMRGSRRRQRD